VSRVVVEVTRRFRVDGRRFVIKDNPNSRNIGSCVLARTSLTRSTTTSQRTVSALMISSSRFATPQRAGDRPTLIVSSEDSPEVLRRVIDRLADALPHGQKVLVTGGHLINPAHPAVLDFIDRIFTPPGDST
jgi:hypothetical protein